MQEKIHLYWNVKELSRSKVGRENFLEEMAGLDVHVPNKKCKSVKDDNLHDQSYKIFYQKGFNSIKECIKQFHSDIAVGPLFVCTCCHQTWFRKNASMLKKTHIPVQSKRLYCTKLHLFILKNGFVTLA